MKIADNEIPYLYLRALIDRNYGAIFNDLSKMEFMSNSISNSIKNNDELENALEKAFDNKLFSSNSLKRRNEFSNLKNYLGKYLYSSNVLKILFNCLDIIGPLTKEYLQKNKNYDLNDYALKEAKDNLKKDGDKAIEYLIDDWSQYTYEASQIIKNNLANELVIKVENSLSNSKYMLDSDLNKILVNSCLAEFHRRIQNAGKSQAGDGLEKCVGLILEHIGLKLEAVPQQITGMLEADHVIRKGGKSHGYMIVISCKTTGRERIKQAVVENKYALLQLKVSRVIWFFRDCDVTQDKLLQLGPRGHTIYLPDKSPKYIEFSSNPECKKFVRPLSTIRDTIDDFFDPTYEE